MALKDKPKRSEHESAPQRQKTKKFGRDWITTIISIISLIFATVSLGFSIVVGYFSVLRVNDDVRMSIRSAPAVFFDNDTQKIRVGGTTRATFINSGNRQASILSVQFYIGFMNANDFAAARSPSCKGVLLESDFEPFVLKEKEIAYKPIKFKAPEFKWEFGIGEDYNTETNGDVTFKLSAQKSPYDGYVGTICLGVLASTPSRTHVGNGFMELDSYQISPPKLLKTHYDNVSPFQIVRESHSIMFGN